MGTGNDDDVTDSNREGRNDGRQERSEGQGQREGRGHGQGQRQGEDHQQGGQARGGGRGSEPGGNRNQQPREGQRRNDDQGRQPRQDQQPQRGQQPQQGRGQQGGQPRQGQHGQRGQQGGRPQQGRGQQGRGQQGGQPQQGRHGQQPGGGGGQGPPQGPGRGGGGGDDGGSRLSGIPVKAVVAIGLIALVGAGAAQVLILGGGNNSAAPSGADASDAVMQVPSGADSVVRMDPGVLEDETMADLYAGVYDATVGNVTGGTGGDGTGPGAGMPSGRMGMIPETLSGVRERIRSQTGVDPTAVEEVVVFQKQRGMRAISQGEMPANPYAGVILHAEWSEQELVGMIENNTMQQLQKTTVSGTTVYKPADGDGGMGAGAMTSGWLAVLSDGEYAVGTSEVVRDVIAVQNGDADPVGGDLLDAYERTPNGFVRMAQRSPSVDRTTVKRINEETGVNVTEYVEAYNDLHIVASSTYTTDSGIGSKSVILTNSTETAKDVKSMVDGLRSVQAGAVQNPTLESELRSISIKRDGTTVTITRETSVENVVEIIEWYLGLFEGSSISPPMTNPVA